MRRFLPLIAFVTLLPAAAFAMEAQTWDFRGQVPQGLRPNNLTTVEVSRDGLYIKTDTDGFLQLPILTGAADVLRMTVTNARLTTAGLMWRTPDLKPDEYYQENIALEIGESQTAIVPLHLLDGWDWSAPFLGIAFPAGTEVLIEDIEWQRYSLPEKLYHSFLSFWTPDTFRLYSINFLWGPLIGSTPGARAMLYDTLPPKAWSAMRIFYGVFALAIIGGLIARWARPADGRRRFVATLAIAGIALWIVFDLRMTQEILSYVRDDWKSYVLQETGERELRGHAMLYDVLDRCRELLAGDARYGLIVTENTPFYSNTRYALLPSIPVRDHENLEGIRSWIVLARGDVTVQNGALVKADGTVLATSGSILERFDDASFIYRTSP